MIAALGGWVIILVILAAIVAIALIAIRAMGINVPPWVGQVLGVVLVAVVIILAVRFLLAFA
jgi:hypothetical protein